MEVWQPVPGHQRQYEISDQGRLRTVLGHTIVKPIEDPDGSIRVKLFSEDGRLSKPRLCDVVGSVFLPREEGKKMKICCLDGNPRNCAVSNLGWRPWQPTPPTRKVEPGLKLRGRPITLKALAQLAGVAPSTIRRRLDKGLSAEEALALPTRKVEPKRYCFRGQWGTVGQLAAMVGVCPVRTQRRIAQGWDVEAALTRESTKYQKYEYKGKEYSLAGLSRINGIDPTTLQRRLRRGWEINRAVEQPSRKRCGLELDGEFLFVADVAERFGISCKAVDARLRRGWTAEQFLASVA